MRILLLIILIPFSGIYSMAQTNLDSLYTVWQDGSQSDSSRVKALSTFIWEGVMFNDADSAVQLSDAMIDFAEQHNYLEGLIEGHHCKGNAYHVQGNYTKAGEHYEKSIAFAEKAGDLQGSAATFNGWAGVMDNLGQREKAMELYERSLAISTEAGDTSGIAAVLQNIGGLYKDQGNLVLAMDMMKKSAAMKEAAGLDRSLVYSLFGIAGIYHNQQDFDPALEYYQRALKISKELDDRAKVAFCLGNMGVMFFDQGKLTEALDYLEQAKAMNTEVGRRKYVADNLFYMGRVSEAQGNFTEALDLYQQALDIQQEVDQKRGIAGTIITMGGLFQKQENTDSALKYCHQGLQLAEEIDAVFWEQMACECLYQTYKIEGKANKALEYHERMIVARDSLYNEKNTKEITQLEMRYDFEKKEAAIKADQEKKDAIAAQELERQKLMRNGFIGGFLVVLLFASVFFFQRKKIAKEKDRSEELLLNILPEEVADELKEKGEAEAQLIDHVTVLFTDFKGFTALSEKLSPKELVDDLNECFSAFDRITAKYGIEKIKTIGDAYMAAGGLPTPNTTHATDVIKAALEMRDFVEAGKPKKVEAGLPFFEIRIGVHTGPVVAGIVGVKKFQYDIWGDTVNTASRMESSGEVGRVNISEATYELVREDTNFSFESRGKIKAKGKGEIEMFFVSKA